MKSQGKPVLLEEFGVTDNQATVYTAWYNEIISSGLTGDLIWCVFSQVAGALAHSMNPPGKRVRILTCKQTRCLDMYTSDVVYRGDTWDDGYAIYPDDPVYALEKSHAAALKARA